MTNERFKTGLISVFVKGEIKEAKTKLGISWRSLIIRGIKSATNKTAEEETEQTDKITRMVDKIRTLSTRIYQLEQHKEEEDV